MDQQVLVDACRDTALPCRPAPWQSAKPYFSDSTIDPDGVTSFGDCLEELVSESMLGRVSDADLRLLRVFAAVAECGGFAAAQALLNVSESTVSTHMHDLETRLGLRLCERGRGGFRLTADGEAVYRSARELFTALDRFQTHVAS